MRSVVLFVHVVGVLALFVGLALEWLSLESLRRSTARAEASLSVRVSAAVPRLSGIAMALILASGFYLGARIGVLGQGWMRASYAALLLMAIVGGPVARSRMRVLRRAAEDPSDRALPALRAAASDALLRASLHVRVAFGLAVVYLMIGKPDASDSALVMGLAAVLAIMTSVPKRQARSTLAEGYR
jgi:uncharacterized membrane protein